MNSLMCKLSNLPIFENENIILILFINIQEKYIPFCLPINGIYENNEVIVKDEYTNLFFKYLNININNRINEKLIEILKDNNSDIKIYICKKKFYDLILDMEKQKKHKVEIKYNDFNDILLDFLIRNNQFNYIMNDLFLFINKIENDSLKTDIYNF